MWTNAKGWGWEYVPPHLIDTSPSLAGLLPESIARAATILPQGIRDGALVVLMADPLDCMHTLATVQFFMEREAKGREIRFALATHLAIRDAIDRVYGGANS